MKDKYSVTTLPFSGYSMFPFLKPGDRLVIRETPADYIQAGDILAVRAGRRQLVVHRVVQILPGRKFVTKGDCLLTPDPQPVFAGDITGKVSAILRERRLLPVSTGHREGLKQIYAWLSIRNLTWGCVKSNVKQLIFKIASGPKTIGRS